MYNQEYASRTLNSIAKDYWMVHWDTVGKYSSSKYFVDYSILNTT